MHARTSKMVEIACKGGNSPVLHVPQSIIAKHGISTTRISIANFAMLNRRPIALTTSFGEAVECYGEKLAGHVIKTYLSTTTWLRLEYRHAPNHYGFG
jgi:hypothetical protein